MSANLKLDKAFVIDVGADGTVTYRPRRTRPNLDWGLPVCSVDTEQEAISIQTRFCRRAYDRFGLPGTPAEIFVLNEVGDRAVSGEAPEIEVGELPGLAERFVAFVNGDRS